MNTDAVTAAGRLQERLSPSSGRVLGWIVVAVAAVMAGLAVFSGPAYGLVWGGVALAGVAWVVLVRPVAGLHEHGVLMQNMLRDTFVPWASIEDCRVAQTLQIRGEGTTHHGLGVSRSARSMMREQRRGGGGGGAAGMLGWGSKDQEITGMSSANESAQSSTTYHAYIETRVLDLAAVGRRKATDGETPSAPQEPVVSWAPAALGALAAAAVAVVLLLV